MRIPLDLPPGLNSDDTTLASAPAWSNGSNVRFRLRRPQVIGGWESVTSTLIAGVCRSVFAWTDNTATLNISFGSHNALNLYQGGAVYDITPASGFTAGAIDGSGSTGYGTGAYGVGGYGVPSVTDYFALTWSQAAWGQTLMACPRNQTIFQWSNNTAVKAVAVANAPAQVTYMLVTPEFQVMALGCSQEVGGVFGPKVIRHCSVRDPTVWATDATSASTAREYPLPGGGRFVAGRVMGQNVLAWSDHELWLGTYVGQITQVWRWDLVGEKCGLIGPGAAVIVGSTAFWISPDRQFHSYTLGGAVTPVACPIRSDFAENLAASQGDKIIASSIAEFNEVRFDYPDSRDGYENSRYVALAVEGQDAGSWYRGIMARTAMVDAGASSYPCGVTYTGQVYWHERGDSADGAAMSWFIRSADVELDPNNTVKASQAWPDLAEQIGPVTMTVYAKFFPQGSFTSTAPLTLSPSDDQVDFALKGRFFQVQFSGNSSPSYVRLGQTIFDVKLNGKR